MESLNLKNLLISNLNIDENDIVPIVENCTVKWVKKDEFLLRENEHCKHTFFVEDGLLRQYSIDTKGKEHTINFASENWFIKDRESAYFDEPSAYYIQALEESEVILMDEKFFISLSEKVPSFIDFKTKRLHNHIRHLQKRIDLLLSSSAEERYLQFMELYPDILSRVPQIMVASYLGITPESLSRVRKDLARKNFRK